MKHSFDHITKQATSAKGMTNIAAVSFHYFNPNGLKARKRKNDALISEAVDAGKCKSGAMLAHGTFDDFSTNRLTDLLELKRIPRIRFHVTIEMLRDSIEGQEKFLLSLEG